MRRTIMLPHLLPSLKTRPYGFKGADLKGMPSQGAEANRGILKTTDKNLTSTRLGGERQGGDSITSANRILGHPEVGDFQIIDLSDPQKTRMTETFRPTTETFQMKETTETFQMTETIGTFQMKETTGIPKITVIKGTFRDKMIETFNDHRIKMDLNLDHI